MKRVKDVSDYLEAGNKFSDLMALVKATPIWRPEVSAAMPKIFMPGHRFMHLAPTEIDWAIGGVVEVGTMGFIASDPKTGKSWLAADLALALATGQPWLGFPVKQMHVGWVTREDAASTSSRRLRRLAHGRGIDQVKELDEWLYVNTRQQASSLMLDNMDEVGMLIADLKYMKVEFLILDVLNKLHCKDENDNAAMTEVMQRLGYIQEKVGCQICVVHHFGKNHIDRRFTQRMRGAGAIAGSAEWAIGVELVDETMMVRKIEFETKADQPPESFYYVIRDYDDGSARMERVAWQEENGGGGRQGYQTKVV